MDWYPEYWNVYPHIETAKQYLTTDQAYRPIDGTPPLNEILIEDDGLYLCNDIGKETPNKAITLEAFKKMEFDILIASLPQHINPFKKLIQLYQPKAKLIYQIGNQWNVEPGSVRNVMASANVQIPPNINGVIYHQEFDLDTFYYTPVKNTKKIYSFINCLNVVDIYKKDWELFLELERLMPDWEFKSFGGQCRDGAIGGSKELADKMREATFIFQCKTDGDGYGHVIHNAAAVGRPLITRRSDYNGKLAEALLYEGSSIEVDNKTPEQIVNEIQSLTPEQIELKGQIINNNFKHWVDFDAEEIKIRAFLDNLQ